MRPTWATTTNSAPSLETENIADQRIGARLQERERISSSHCRAQDL